MSLIKNSLKDQIDDYNRLQFTSTTGTIIEYDRTSELCKIKYLNPNGEGYIYKGNVHINHSAGGLSSGSFHVGQTCSISFINNNVYNPVVDGVVDNYYPERKCTDQGAYLADDEVFKVGTPEHIIAMNLDWIDNANKNLSKYENSSARYTNVDINQIALDLITTLDKYDDDEVGLTNLKNKSTIKLRDNGDIDIFTTNNTGIRICENGNIKIYGNDIEFTNLQTETTDKSLSTQLKVSQIMKICVAYDIIKETDEYVKVIEESIGDDTELNGDQT